MPTTTYTPGYGGTLQIGSISLPVTNVSVDLTRDAMDVTSFADMFTYSMAGRVTRKASCTALISAQTISALNVLFESSPVVGTHATLSWSDANSASFTMTAMCTSATKSYDNSGAATMQFQFTEAYAT